MAILYYIQYASYIDHIFIIHSSIFNMHQPTSSGKETENRKKKSGGFFHLCSTTNIVQSFEPQGCRSHGSSFQWSSKFCWMLEGMACYSKTLGSLASSIYLTVKQVVVLIFFVDSHFLIPSISIQKKQSKMFLSFHPLSTTKGAYLFPSIAMRPLICLALAIPRELV